MAKPTFTDLKEQTDEIYAAYAANFAGKPRATRDLDLLEDLIAQLTSAVETARGLLNGNRNPALLSLIETATDNLQRYQTERGAISDAQANPHAVYGATLAARANRNFDVYARHFGGQDRATRDRMLLHELALELESLQASMQQLVARGADNTRGDLETVTNQLEMYRAEITNIARAQTVGTPEEVASRLAQLANDQFALYTNHFAGKSRLTRRPALIKRMIDNLEEYREEMRELADNGYSSQSNRNNIGTVGQNLEMYRRELAEILKARNETEPADLAGALGGAANDVFALYGEHFAGKERKTRDLDLAGVICDQLRDIALQMREIEDTIENDTNSKNLVIVEERWATYEEEWRNIARAKGIA